MLAEQSLRDGQLQQALEQLQQQVRQEPANPKYRVFLFQLLAVLGQWERALNQLNVAAEMDDANLAMAQTYRETLRCEMLRTEVFSGQRTPLVFGEPQQWLALLIEAQRYSAQGDVAQAKSLRERALVEAPATPGTINDQPFTWVADADLRLGPVLELIVNGRYYWVPFQNIHRIQLEPPHDLRDLVWMPAQLTWANAGQAVGFIPVRYPGSEHSDDNLIRLARKTTWSSRAEEALEVGAGQRLLATDSDDYALLEITHIELHTLEAEHG